MARKTKQDRIDELEGKLAATQADLEVVASSLEFVTDERNEWIKRCGVLEKLLEQERGE